MDESSFVIVNEELDPSAVLSCLVEFFPSLTDSTDFSTWSLDRQASVRQARNARPDGRLFIDELLRLVEIDGSVVYPPTSAQSLHSLLFDLLTSPSLLKAHCIVFYLLLAQSDSQPSATTQSIPWQFARKMLLPTGFLRGIEGFYSLDSSLWRAAVSALTDPHLTPDFVPKTLEVLSTLPPLEDRASLVLSYWRLSAVALADQSQLGFILDALCDKTRKRGVVQAWALMRGWDGAEGEQDELAKRILARVFGDNLTATPVPHHLQALLAQPFTPAEDALVDTFCLGPPPSLRPASRALCGDWRLSKLIAEGRPVAALRFGGRAAAAGSRGTEERARLLRAVRDTLTEVQKSEIDLEGDASSSSAPALPPANGASTSNIANPAWQAQPAKAPAPLPRSLASLNKQSAPVQAPTPSELPLSASPFLRQTAPLVGTRDGGALGGAQKSVLRALREGTADPAIPGNKGKGKGKAPESTRTGSLFGGSEASPRRFVSMGSASEAGTGSPRAGSTTFGQDGREVLTPRKPTLSGFGSVRQPAGASYRMREASEEPESEGEVDHQPSSSPPPPAPRAQLPAIKTISNGAPIPDSPFASRAAQDPAIANAINAATPARPGAATRTPRAEIKRKPSSSRDAAHAVPEEKRRAVSVEPEDRPTSKPVSSSNATGGLKRSKTQTLLPPGGFPGMEEEDHHMEDESAPAPVEAEPAPKSRGRKSIAPSTSTPAKATRRSARASSVQPPAEPATPRPRTRLASSSSQQQLLETPKNVSTATGTRMSTRKSSRLLNTPAAIEREERERETSNESAKKPRTATRKTATKKKTIEEE